MVELEHLGLYLRLLLPWEFSALWSLVCLGAVVVYLRGLRRRRRNGHAAGFWRPCAFLLGVTAIYAVTQTHYDYLAQFMFFTHRAQHLVLHHAAPFLIVLAAPLPVLLAGLPSGFGKRASRASRAGLEQLPLLPALAGVLAGLAGRLYRLVQHPVLAPVLFVGLIYFWLVPEIHFDAMLSRFLYQVMNWSMAIDGLLFWWLMLDPRPWGKGGLHYGVRVLILWLVMVAQILLGAVITFSDRVLFDVYAVCGRAWPLDPLDDQQLGGLITWIPPAMMSVLGMLVVITHALRQDGKDSHTAGYHGHAALEDKRHAAV